MEAKSPSEPHLRPNPRTKGGNALFPVMKTVHLVSMCVTLSEDRFEEGAEIWGVNRAYRTQPGLTRVFFFDSPHHFKYPPIVDDLRDTPFTVWTRKPYPEIKNNRIYPRDKVVGEFGLEFFTCSVAWMLGLAIHEGFERIVLHGMYMPHDSVEYMHHIPCINFWTGIALGKGINVIINGDSGIAKPFPWQPGLYGYTAQENEQLSIRSIAATYKACAAYPVHWLTSDELETKQIAQLAKRRLEAYEHITDDQLRLLAKSYGLDESATPAEIKDRLDSSHWEPNVGGGVYTSSDRLLGEMNRIKREEVTA